MKYLMKSMGSVGLLTHNFEVCQDAFGYISQFFLFMKVFLFYYTIFYCILCIVNLVKK